MKIRHMAMLAMYTTIALTIFTIESLLPGLAPVSGIKLGLSNIVTLWLLLYASQKDAFLCLVMRILTASLIAGQMVSFAYSLCGGVFCFCTMAVLFRIFGKKYIVFISVIGAVFHNLGQILIAVIVLQSFSILSYLPLLTISGIAAGTFTGLCTHYAAKRLTKDQVWLP
ncbi:Gx transporter family protein [Hominisplanchenecus murintestinalis]|uniref:Gx transporter family protein n=1 Tax=Hominisplanchenecus murintestinalis TaxID=2941517 RepID=A0AC61QZ56_9FIRM|nr:Gx transporter family protein [Hominisplanchenecus murintestinalis]NBH97728.1 Gx transporter family protein [Lachnospiraceae bacterium]NBI74784.1 Gx transporter family protein [Lachnospiraceae bacterium]RKJ95755.1 Gx transporter family protein [Anaerotruncus sp. 1XD22-93]TGX98282.1 Gx transporter family protein [Hominisplanchenecus murintestinalis]